MPRKMIVMRGENETPSLLTEVLAENELQLQEQLKNNPDLLPVEEFGINGPLMVVGRETQLPSGAVDLVALARGGEVLIVEFKTGPQNADFRRVLAQLLDYGSDLWQMSLEDFQGTVARRYFESDHCQHVKLRGLDSLEKAAGAFWVDLSAEEMSRFQDRVGEQLRTGAFHYVVVAQRFLPTMERTMAYMNASMTAAQFYAVELVRFTADQVSAFEARTVMKPAPATTTTAVVLVNEARFLDGIADLAYREALHRLLDQCKQLDLRFEWGAKGTSIRIATPVRREPFSIGWLFPPGIVGWMGLTDITLGYDSTSVKQDPALIGIFDDYVKRVASLPGALGVRPAWLRGHRLDPTSVVTGQNEIINILTELVGQVNAGG